MFYQTGVWRKTAQSGLADVSLAIAPGEIFGLTGASGSGKTTLIRTLVGLIAPNRGTVRFQGIDLWHGGQPSLHFRQRVQLIFQDARAALNPRHTAYAIVEEPLRIHHRGGRPERSRRVAELFARVGLSTALYPRFPSQLSAGQCQRVGIARALALDPVVLLADEPTSALDGSAQAQIINLLCDLHRQMAFSMIWVGHDLRVMRHFTDRVGIMAGGRLVCIATAGEMLAQTGPTAGRGSGGENEI